MDFTEVIDTAKRFAGKREDSSNYDDFLVDRCHHRYTVALLICFCIAMSTYQYIGNPLQCWVPAQFTNNYEDYANQLCYIQNTYHVPKHQLIPQDADLRRERTLKYYQWIHFVLLIQAFFFSLPRIIWQSFNEKIGIPIGSLIYASNQYHALDDDADRNTVIYYISDRLQQYSEYVNPSKHHQVSKSRRFINRWHLFCQARTGSSLTFFYILIKCFYACNLIFQILFLQYFLSYHDVHYIQYGYDIIQNLLTHFTLPESKLFPRITLCDFQIRELSERHKYTIECILTINIFIEKLYFVLWLWFGLLFFVTIFDILNLIYRLFFLHSRNLFLSEHLDLVCQSQLVHEKQYEYFRRYFLIDNLFALRLIAVNSSPLIAGEVLGELFRRTLRDDSEV